MNDQSTLMNANDPNPEPRLRRLFLAALDLPDGAARAGFLEEACGGDRDLRRQLEDLLAGHREDDSFLEHPAVDRDSAVTVDSRVAGPTGTVAVGPVPPAAPATLRYFGDYELLGEIARGGMGVVWQARQKSLNRRVAVKMILGGQLATEADVKRFHTEAEAAANLKHPNIVAIHEIGEHEGRHYFSMDLIEGRNLAQVIGNAPMPPRQAATLMKTLAEAVHYAHQRGTLHRDLKPQNVLLDAEGRPHITDFGLAKQLSTDSDLTRTGTIMGSPSYMPPEQALGKQGEVGPASDVYSLGAILYQLLTGKAPFLGATAVDTLRLVVEQEPVSPAKLTDQVPSDLETICLRCLEKHPGRRYATARALAEELDRFLRHEPILAKPASAARKVVSWCRQRPWVVSGLAVLLMLGLTGLAFGLWQKSEFLQWRMAHPKAKVPGEIMRTPVILLLTGILLWIASVLSGVHWSEVKRQRLAPIPPWLNRFVKVIGTLLGLLAIGLALTSIRGLVWYTQQDHREMAVGLTGLAFAVAFCWTGMLVTWRFGRLDELLGIGRQEPEQPRFTLAVNWPGMLVLLPLLLLGSPPLVRWFLAAGQFQPLPGMFPGAEEPVILDAAMRQRVDALFAQMFGLGAGSLALLVYVAGLFLKRPRDEWRDLTPPVVCIGLGFCTLTGLLLPRPVAAAAIVSGALAGIALLKVAGLRRIESPAETDPGDWSTMLNHPAYKRALPWVFTGMVLPPFLLGLGNVPNQAYLALTWFALANLFATAGRLRSASRNTWCSIGLSLFIVIYFFTAQFTRSIMLPQVFMDPLLLLPPVLGGYFLHRALKQVPGAAPAPAAPPNPPPS
jgi:hypothetical protein